MSRRTCHVREVCEKIIQNTSAQLQMLLNMCGDPRTSFLLGRLLVCELFLEYSDSGDDADEVKNLHQQYGSLAFQRLMDFLCKAGNTLRAASTGLCMAVCLCCLAQLCCETCAGPFKLPDYGILLGAQEGVFDARGAGADRVRVRLRCFESRCRRQLELGNVMKYNKYNIVTQQAIFAADCRNNMHRLFSHRCLSWNAGKIIFGQAMTMLIDSE